MQVGSVNSFNFKGLESSKRSQAEDYKFGDDYTVRTESENSVADSLNIEEKLNKFASSVDKANNDVHIGTVLIAGATFLGLLYKGRKVIDLGTRMAATAGEVVAKGGVKLINSLKKTPVETTEKTLNNISSAVSGFREKVGKKDEKFLEGIKNTVDKIAPKKGEGVAYILDKFGINNKTSIATTAAAAVGATAIADKVSDVTENKLDNKDIDRAKKELLGDGIHILSELADVIL